MSRRRSSTKTRRRWARGGSLRPASRVGVDPQGDHFLVVGAVEDADPAALGQRRPVPVQVAVLHVLVGRLAEVGHPEALGIDARRDVLDGAVLAGGVHALEYQQHRLSALRVHHLLQLGETRNLLFASISAQGRLAATGDGGNAWRNLLTSTFAPGATR